MTSPLERIREALSGDWGENQDIIDPAISALEEVERDLGERARMRDGLGNLAKENTALRAEVEMWRRLKLHNEGTGEIVRALNDRAALVDQVVEKCARACEKSYLDPEWEQPREGDQYEEPHRAARRIGARCIRSLDRAKLLSEAP